MNCYPESFVWHIAAVAFTFGAVGGFLFRVCITRRPTPPRFDIRSANQKLRLPIQ